jgi:hypothetical protein
MDQGIPADIATVLREAQEEAGWKVDVNRLCTSTEGHPYIFRENTSGDGEAESNEISTYSVLCTILSPSEYSSWYQYVSLNEIDEVSALIWIPCRSFKQYWHREGNTCPALTHFLSAYTTIDYRPNGQPTAAPFGRKGPIERRKNLKIHGLQPSRLLHLYISTTSKNGNLVFFYVQKSKSSDLMALDWSLPSIFVGLNDDITTHLKSIGISEQASYELEEDRLYISLDVKEASKWHPALDKLLPKSNGFGFFNPFLHWMTHPGNRQAFKQIFHTYELDPLTLMDTELAHTVAAMITAKFYESLLYAAPFRVGSRSIKMLENREVVTVLCCDLCFACCSPKNVGTLSKKFRSDPAEEQCVVVSTIMEAASKAGECVDTKDLAASSKST